jgi:hypothetical protein
MLFSFCYTDISENRDRLQPKKGVKSKRITAQQGSSLPLEAVA